MLTNVARASLDELRLDYEDFLRQRGLPLRAKDDPRRTHLVARRSATADDLTKWVKGIHDGQVPSISSIKSIPSIKAHLSRDGRQRARGSPHGHILSGVACALLDPQIAAHAKAFETEGGFTERLDRVRSKNRNKQQ